MAPLVGAIASALLIACEPAATPATERSSANGAVAQASAPATSAATATEITRPEVGFRDRSRLDEHWRKHRGEFGDPSREEYLRLAQRLRDAPTGERIEELVRSDDVITRFDRATGAFIAFDPDGTIRTFFRPNDGESYFRRQARRRPTS